MWSAPLTWPWGQAENWKSNLALAWEPWRSLSGWEDPVRAKTGFSERAGGITEKDALARDGEQPRQYLVAEAVLCSDKAQGLTVLIMTAVGGVAVVEPRRLSQMCVNLDGDYSAV